MQDAVELNFSTVKRAHAAVLQEIARGKENWDQLDLIEKTKDTYTQRLIQSQKIKYYQVLFKPVTILIKGFVG